MAKTSAWSLWRVIASQSTQSNSPIPRYNFLNHCRIDSGLSVYRLFSAKIILKERDIAVMDTTRIACWEKFSPEFHFHGLSSDHRQYLHALKVILDYDLQEVRSHSMLKETRMMSMLNISQANWQL